MFQKQKSHLEGGFFVFVLLKMAGETGLEPAAFCVTGRRYNQLNYSPGAVNVHQI